MSSDNSSPNEPRQLGDVLSLAIKASTDFVIGRYPLSISIGIVAGLALHWLAQLLKSYLSPWVPFDYSLITPVNLGIFFVFIGILVSETISIFKRRPLPSSVEDAIVYIELSRKKAKLSQAQVRLMYLSLYRKVLTQIELSENIQEEVEKLEKLGKPENRSES